VWLSDAGAAAGVLVTGDRQWQLTMANEATHAARSNCSFAAVRLQLLSPLIASASVDVFLTSAYVRLETKSAVALWLSIHCLVIGLRCYVDSYTSWVGNVQSK